MNSGPVLYAEDEENDVLLMQISWKKAGITNPLQIVADGAAALAYFSGENEYADRDKYPLPCLVMLDLKLPKVNGSEVLKWIRQQPALHLIPVIIFSSSNKPQDVCTAYELRANAYLMKPGHVEDLVETIVSLKNFWLRRVESPLDCLELNK